jgi:hypothetical protein
VTAQARELRARADLNQAVSLFERAVGGTLERHGVRVGSAIARSRDRVIG